MKRLTPRQALRQRFPSPCDSEWLKKIAIGDEVMFCYGGTASHHPSTKAVVTRRGLTFIEVNPDGYFAPTRLSEDGCQRFYGVNYFMYIAPVR